MDDEIELLDTAINKEPDIGGRIHQSNLQDAFNMFENEIGSELMTFVGKPINVYQFRKVSGVTTFSTSGQGGLEVNPNELAQYTQIYSSNEPVTIVWKNSTYIEVVNGLRLEKVLRPGVYFPMYYMRNDATSDVEDNNISIFNVDYKTQSAKRTIELMSEKWEVSLDDQLNHLYLIIDPTIQFHQLLEIKSYTNFYHHNEERAFLKSSVQFESVNFKFANTGRNILEAIQFAAAGEEFAYPKEIIGEDNEVLVKLERQKLEVDGAASLQLDFDNAVALSSIRLIGRTKNIVKDDYNEDETRFIVDTPSFLFLSDIKPPHPNPFTYNTPNGTNTFHNLSHLSKTSIWADYKTAWRDNLSYNMLETKEVRAGFKHSEVQNQDGDNFMWDPRFSVDMTKFFQADEIRNSINSIPYIKTEFTSNSFIKKINDWLNINGLYNSNTEALNYEYKELVRWSLKSVLGVFGNVVQILMGGLDWGWTTTRILKDMFKNFNFTQPYITFNDFEAIYGQKWNVNGKLQPIDFFDDNKSKNMLPVNTNIYCAYHFGLTNYFRDTSNTRPGADLGKGGNGIWKTLYIGQSKFEDLTNIRPDAKPLRIDLSRLEAFNSLDNNEFILDYIEFKAIAGSNYKISVFNAKGQEIYGYYGKTIGKVKEDLRLWTNRIKLNYYDNINSFGNLLYPEPIEPVDPTFTRTDKIELNVNQEVFDVTTGRIFDIDATFENERDWPNDGDRIYLSELNNIHKSVGQDYFAGFKMRNKQWFSKRAEAQHTINYRIRNSFICSRGGSGYYFEHWFRAFTGTQTNWGTQSFQANFSYRLKNQQGQTLSGSNINFKRDNYVLNGWQYNIKTIGMSNPKTIKLQFKDLTSTIDINILNLNNGAYIEKDFMMYNKTNSEYQYGPVPKVRSRNDGGQWSGWTYLDWNYEGNIILVNYCNLKYRIRITRQSVSSFLLNIVPIVSQSFSLVPDIRNNNNRFIRNRYNTDWNNATNPNYKEVQFEPTIRWFAYANWNNIRWNVRWNDKDDWHNGGIHPVGTKWNYFFGTNRFWILEKVIVENDI